MEIVEEFWPSMILMQIKLTTSEQHEEIKSTYLIEFLGNKLRSTSQYGSAGSHLSFLVKAFH
jgi:hypothetical protein